MMAKIYVTAFSREQDLLDAIAAARQCRWPPMEAYMPYPVHGLSTAMGLRPSRLGKVCFLFGLVGVTLALAFQYWSTARNWPLNVGGQPWNSLPAFLPVTFETMVLLAGLGMVATWLVRCQLYPGSPNWQPDCGETDDRFVLAMAEPGRSAEAAEFRRRLREDLATTLEEREF
jgi:hypothetical protein